MWYAKNAKFIYLAIWVNWKFSLSKLKTFTLCFLILVSFWNRLARTSSKDIFGRFPQTSQYWATNILCLLSISVSSARNTASFSLVCCFKWWVATENWCILSKQNLIWVYNSRIHRTMELLGPRRTHFSLYPFIGCIEVKIRCCWFLVIANLFAF